MRLIITGGSGLLGSAVAALSQANGYETYTGYNQHQANEGTPIPLDITNIHMIEKAFQKAQPKIVIHSAAMTNVDRCEENQTQATMINVKGTRNIVKEAKKYGAFVLYVSTDYIFSGEKGGYLESDEPSPINHYGATKLEGEQILISSNIEYCIVRPSVIYGSRPAAGKENFALWVINNLRNGKLINIVDDNWVSPTLNTNLAEMILEIVERRLTGVYHLSGATPINRYDFTKQIAKTFGLDESLILPVTSEALNWKARRPRNSTLNVAKASATLSSKPLEIQAALKRVKDEIVDQLEKT
ncbi:MAG: dTDP-4-dehydrorhamnose reductase [Candidatus Bathyarchaeota archaeon]